MIATEQGRLEVHRDDESFCQVPGSTYVPSREGKNSHSIAVEAEAGEDNTRYIDRNSKIASNVKHSKVSASKQKLR